MAGSIEVRIPEEIMEYKESILMGLSVRQLVCGSIALAVGIPTFFLLKGISEDLATYATMVVVIPAFLVGFIKKDGYNFETYFKIRLYNFFAKSKRGYETELQDGLPIDVEEYRAIMQEINSEDNVKKGSEKSVRSNSKTKKAKKLYRPECEFIEVTEKSIKRKRKAAYKSIKAKARKY
ncbi:MAG: PrgI family protein [Firmicutes bacterium]|nr:PrgI family protein [Bacillota bacterium]